MRKIQFSDVPTVSDFETETLHFLQSGISNSDDMRAAIANKLGLKLDKLTGPYWSQTPSGRFVNLHAHALRRLVEQEIIRPRAKREYVLLK